MTRSSRCVLVSRKRLLPYSETFIAVSRFIAEQALSRGCPEAKLKQHYIGIDLEKFTRDKDDSAGPTLLFVGRLVERQTGSE